MEKDELWSNYRHVEDILYDIRRGKGHHTACDPHLRRVRAQQRRVAYARSRESRTRAATSRVRAEQGAHPKTSEAPTHFGPPRAVRTACRNLVKHQRILGHPCRAVYRNLVKHQRILGIPNLSATCGVRPLPAVSVRDRRCVGRACKNRHEHTLAKTVTNTRAGSVLFFSIPGL